MNKRQIGILLRLTVSIALLGILAFVTDMRSFRNILSQLKLGYYLCGVLLYFAVVSMVAIRWQLILKQIGQAFPLQRLVTINFIGGFFAIFLPTAIGGDVARMYELSYESGRGSEAVSSVLIDRLVGLTSLIVLAFMALIVGKSFVSNGVIIASFIAIATVTSLACWLLFHQSGGAVVHRIIRLPLLNHLESRLDELYRSVHEFRGSKKLLGLALVVSLLLQGLEVISVVAIAYSLNIHVPTVLYFVFVPLIWLVTMVPLSLNGLGLREGAFVFFFGQAGVISSEAIMLGLLVYSCRILAGLLGGLLFLQTSVSAYLRSNTAAER